MLSEIIPIAVDSVTPSPAAALRAQGVPDGTVPSDRVLNLINESIALYQAHAKPVGLLAEICRNDFHTLLHGENNDIQETPLATISESASHLALFAVTIGEPVCQEISRLFERSELALGALLDTIASEGTEMVANRLEDSYLRFLRESGLVSSSAGTMRFSPGYCGWELSAQRRLFELLRPEEIGIELLPSSLMRPLKSISGVIVAGPRESFAFEDDYVFCSACDTHSCRERLTAMTSRK